MSSLTASPTPQVVVSTAAPSAGPRVASLDVLRGFDMFWILGGDVLMRALGATWNVAPFTFLAGQFRHKSWAGFAFYDLIFPLFLFIAGASLVFSISRTIEQHGRGVAIKRVLVRGLIIFLLGVFYNGGMSNSWPDIRVLGVLQRIGLVFAATGVLFCFFRPKALVGITAALLLGYYALLAFVPIRDFPLTTSAISSRLEVKKPTMEQVRTAYFETTDRVTGKFEPGFNLASHFDFEHLPGRKNGYYDPLGMLSTFPAIATCLLGVFAGVWLRRTDLDHRQKLRRMIIAGVATAIVGWWWHLEFPVVKRIWTSTFVLVAAGYSFLLLAAFYYVVDVRGWRNWCRPFLWIGMNAITLYLLDHVVDSLKLAERFAGGSVKAFFDAHVAVGAGNLFLGIVAIFLVLATARFLYRRQIFLRV